jgi:hypothetical protein
MTVKIVFRGLLVFNDLNGAMQIGVLEPHQRQDNNGNHPHVAKPEHALAHVPRIITTKNGVITSILDLRTRPELRSGGPGHVRDWEIFVSHPLQPSATTDTRDNTTAQPWDRKTHTYAKDYRFMTHLDGGDLHGAINNLQTNSLTMVLNVRNGLFYTDQLSRRLNRKNITNGPNGAEEEFGPAAEVTGCDILTKGGTVELRANGNIIFKFKQSLEEGVVYEFSNAPPDVLPDRVYALNELRHFRLYHHLFGSGLPADRWDLVPQVDLAPAPDPALCGATRVTPRSGGI